MKNFGTCLALAIIAVGVVYGMAGLDYHSANSTQNRYDHNSQLGISPKLLDAEKQLEESHE